MLCNPAIYSVTVAKHVDLAGWEFHIKCVTPSMSGRTHSGCVARCVPGCVNGHCHATPGCVIRGCVLASSATSLDESRIASLVRHASLDWSKDVATQPLDASYVAS